MSRFHVLALLAATAMFSVGCGGARVVHRSQEGGVIALEGDRNKAVERAHQLMDDHCGGPYKVLEEGENLDDTEGGEIVEEGVESASDAAEWRMRYMCGNGPPAPAAERAGSSSGAAGTAGGL